MLAVLILASSISAQNSDWQKVEFLEPGRFIRVKTDHIFYCSHEGATDDRLICERRSVIIDVPRAEIREIRLLPVPDDRYAKIGAVIGAAGGAIAGGAPDRPYRGVHAFIGGLAGAGFGFLIGVTVGGTAAGLQLATHRGKLIYRR